jgi:hypothetical protein
MGIKKYIDFNTGSVSDSEIQLVADGTTGALSKVSLKQQKDYFQQGLISGSFVVTSSFNTFSSSYSNDSASFNTRINAITGSTAVSGANTSIPIALNVGILANGTNQISNLNTVFSNANYSGITIDYIGGGGIYISGSLNCNGRTLRFVSGSYIYGTGSVTNFTLDCGLTQKCFDISSSGRPSITLGLNGTTQGKLSPYVFGAKPDGNDCARALQATIDCCIANGSAVNEFFLPDGTYTCNSPLIQMNWNPGSSTYAFHMIKMTGTNTFSSADGFGSTIDFSGRKDSFGIGVQLGKGASISGIKLIGGFNYSFPGAYSFYSSSFSQMTDGVSRDTTYSPNSGIVVDPFGASIPADGGWPNNDAYSIPLSTYYRGSGGAGSTGTCLDQVYIRNFVIGVISSPNGSTANAEELDMNRMQFGNMKICIVSCQSQEKNNCCRMVEAWGVIGCFFVTGIYGAASPGSYFFSQLNFAGFCNQMVYNPEQSYFPTMWQNIYFESLGKLGTITGTDSATIRDSTLNFATLTAEVLQYPDGQISGQGIYFENCQIRMFGQNSPVTINAVNGPLYFSNCSFDVPPFYNEDYNQGYCSFSNCNVAGTNFLMNPNDMQTISGPSFSNTFAYGNIKVKIGNPQGATRIYNIKSSNPATRFPINRTTSNYFVSSSLVSGYHYTYISCSSDEYLRVKPNDWLCYDLLGNGVGSKMLGIVTTVTTASIQVQYVPQAITTGSIYVYNWLALHNISFTGDLTNGSNIITNVSVIDGTMSDFVATGLWGGLLQSRTFTPSSDAWNFGMCRLMSYNSGANTITVDRQAGVTKSKLLFTNTDATIEPASSLIFLTGSAIGAAGTGSITKGNDSHHQLSVTTGTGTSTGTIGSVSFSYPFAGAYIPSINFSPANSLAAALSGSQQIFMDATGSANYTINTGTSALATSSTYIWNIQAS